MNKYIIKNCECKVKGKTTLCVRDIPYKKCENITDCKLKQIYEKCENTIIQNPNQEDDTFEFDVGRESLGTEIIGLLDIQEVE